MTAPALHADVASNDTLWAKLNQIMYSIGEVKHEDADTDTQDGTSQALLALTEPAIHELTTVLPQTGSEDRPGRLSERDPARPRLSTYVFVSVAAIVCLSVCTCDTRQPRPPSTVWLRPRDPRHAKTQPSSRIPGRCSPYVKGEPRELSVEHERDFMSESACSIYISPPLHPAGITTRRTRAGRTEQPPGLYQAHMTFPVPLLASCMMHE